MNGEANEMRRVRLEVTIWFLDDGTGDDWEGAIGTYLMSDCDAASYDTKKLEDVTLVPAPVTFPMNGGA